MQIPHKLLGLNPRPYFYLLGAPPCHPCVDIFNIISLSGTKLFGLIFVEKVFFCPQRQETPLHLAVKNSHIPVIHLLLAAGCDINVTDDVRPLRPCRPVKCLLKFICKKKNLESFPFFFSSITSRGPRLRCILLQS